MRSKTAHAPYVLPAGTAIEVRCHLNCPWSPGFEVDEAVLVDDEVAYRIRRAHPRRVLPAVFGSDYVRRLGRRSPDVGVSGGRELERSST
jgi:hypothetical protein